MSELCNHVWVKWTATGKHTASGKWCPFCEVEFSDFENAALRAQLAACEAEVARLTSVITYGIPSLAVDGATALCNCADGFAIVGGVCDWCKKPRRH